MMRKLFSRKAAAVTPSASALPAEVGAAIEASHVIIRADAGVVLVQIPGFAPIKHSLENAREFFSGAFGELNTHQVERAVRYLAAHVSKRVALQSRQDDRERGSEAWAAWRPLRMPSMEG